MKKEQNKGNWPLNKFGVPEQLHDQCDNQTCKCGESYCEVDDRIFFESALLDVYKGKMKCDLEQRTRNKEQGLDLESND